MLDVDDTAPTFDLTDHNGDSVSLDDYEGSRVVLYFYPKAKTGGCTREAQGFRDNLEAFAERGVEVLGASTDSVELLSEFAAEQDLPFRLLSDEDGAVARAYDSLRDSGRAERNTYVIGPDGRIEAAYEGVSPDGHPEQVLADIEALEEASP